MGHAREGSAWGQRTSGRCVGEVQVRAVRAKVAGQHPRFHLSRLLIWSLTLQLQL